MEENEDRRKDMSLEGCFDGTAIPLVVVSAAALAAGDPYACVAHHIPGFLAGHPDVHEMKRARCILARSLTLVPRGADRAATGMTGLTSASQTSRTAGCGVTRRAHDPVPPKKVLPQVTDFPCPMITDAAEIERLSDTLASAYAAALALQAPGAAMRAFHAAAALTLAGLTMGNTWWTSFSHTVNCIARERA